MTDIQLAPRQHDEYGRNYAVQSEYPAVALIDATQQSREQLELAAYEKGRMAGEMEAIRRQEAEAQLQPKQMIVTQQDMDLIAAPRPDVVEINRPTWLQRVSYVLGTLSGLGMIALTLWWIEKWRGTVGWENSSSDAVGYRNMYNTFLLTAVLGLFCTSQAITNYRMLPIRTPPMLNRAWYMLVQSCAIVSYTLAIVALYRTPADSSYWSGADWCFAAGYGLTVSHALYSMAHALFAHMRMRNARANGNIDGRNDNMSELNNETNAFNSPEQSRDGTVRNAAGRSLYAPAPMHNHIMTNSSAPNAPANAPRWAETPTQHAEDFWLMARAKWAVAGFWAIGAAILMEFASLEAITAAGRDTFAQGPAGNTDWSETGRERDVAGASMLLILFACALISYAAMPPRTTVVKNGFMQQQRRTSISHNADTQIGHQIV